MSETKFSFGLSILYGWIRGLLLTWATSSLMVAYVCAGESGIFVETGDLAFARAQHSATLLPNGKVLAAGGRGLGGVDLSSAELYDPENGTWTPTESLVNARGAHTATLLPNGKVLAAGGYGTTGPLASCELYDPGTGVWSLTGSLPNARYYHTATLLPDGKVLVAGGGDSHGVIAITELYNPATGTWAPTGSLLNARFWHTATLLPNGKVLVAGGLYTATSSAELYDPVVGEWTLTGPMVDQHVDHTATLLPNGKVLVAGWHEGNTVDAELYDPENGTWRPTGNPIHQRVQHTATLLQDGKVLVVAGWNNGSTLGSAELYNPVSEMWITTADLIPPARTHHTATLLYDGQVLVAGGSDVFDQLFNSAELYNGGIPTQTPTPSATPIPTATVSPTATPTPIATPTPTPSAIPIATLGNISTRLGVGTADNVLIGGFIITGSDPKQVLLRGLGPSLPLGGTLADPVLELHGPNGFATITCDNWRDCPGFTASPPPGLAPPNDLEAAMIVTLNPGPYTAILRGNDNTSGVALVEAYDLDRIVDSKLANISTRGLVQTGDNVMIAGTIVLGGASQRVIARALGPSLPVPGKLADPALELRDENGGLLRSNDNWRSDQEAEIIATGIAPPDDLESAIVATLSAGGAAYTAIVRGVDDAVGVAVVEVYALN